MIVHLILAALLAGIAAYTDIKVMKIYNKHLAVFFALGLLLMTLQRRYDLLVSAGLVLALYLFLYYGGRTMSNIAVSLGLMPLPSGARPMAGGDLKLAVTLALLLGHYPVLYGTMAGVLLLVAWQGVKRWRFTGSPRAIADVALGRVHAPAAFGPWLGFGTLAAALILMV